MPFLRPSRLRLALVALVALTTVCGCKNRRYPPTVDLALTADHAVIATKGKGGWTAGSAENGALGFGLPGSPSPAPRLVPDAPADVLEVAASAGASCLRTATEVRCVGGKRNFGNGFFTAVPELSGVTQIALRTETAGVRVCGRSADARVRCVELGGVANAVPLDAPRVAALASGPFGLFVVRDDGRVARVEDGFESPKTEEISGLAQILQVGVGDRHACAVDAGGAVFCWGANGSGRLGDGTDVDRPLPVAVANVSGAVSVHPGADFTCVLRRDETIGCWGANDVHQLADGTTDRALLAKPVFGAFQVTGLVVGGRGACAAQKDGGSRCWGANGTGRFGDKTTHDHPVPMPIKIL